MASAKAIVLAVLSAALLQGCGKREEIPRTPSLSKHRVVSLAPSITEIVCAVGGPEVMAGRTSACDYTAEIKDTVPVIGQFGKPSLELLLTASPTLVLDVALSDEAVGKKIEQLGIKRERIRCENLNDICEAIVRVGELLELEKEAKDIAELTLMEAGLSGDSNPTLSIFLLKVNHGMQDKVIIEQDIKAKIEPITFGEI